MQEVVSKLREAALKPPPPKERARKLKDPIPFCIEWHSSLFNRVPLLRLLKEAPGWPLHPSHKEHLLVAKQLPGPIGMTICNHRTVARYCGEYTPPDDNCPCRRFFDPKFRPNGGCVSTMDPSVSGHIELTSLLKQGAKFREHIRANSEEIISTALGRFSRYCEARFNVQQAAMQEWCTNVKQVVTARLPPPQGGNSLLKRPDVSRTLRDLKTHLVICVTDKADKNFSFVCKNLYKHTLMMELQSENGAYETVNKTPEQIYSTYHNQLLQGKCPKRVKQQIRADIREQKFRFSTLYWLPKMHKTPPKARFISGSKNIMTTQLARSLNCILALIKKALRDRDQHHLQQTGVKRCWFIDSFDQVTWNLRNHLHASEEPQQKLATYDFATMYTTLEQRDLVHSLDYAIKEAFGLPTDPPEIKRHRFLVFKGVNTPPKWHDAIDDNDINVDASTLYSADDITRLVRILVEHTFIRNGDLIKRQHRGLPMGTNPAPHLADLTCYRYEARAMDRMIIRGDIQQARSFATTFRFIDDILSLNNPHFCRYVSVVNAAPVDDPIYPSFLALNCTTDSEHSVTYLGMKISKGKKSFITSLCPSSKSFPYPKIRYPSLLGNFPKTLAYGVFYGQLHRFTRVCSTATNFISCCADIYEQLLPKGYARIKLRRLFGNFISSHNPYKTPSKTLQRRFASAIKGK
jgi:hypothetical protein